MSQVRFSYTIHESAGKRGTTYICDAYVHSEFIRQKLNLDQGKVRVRKTFKSRDEAVHLGERIKALVEKKGRKVYQHRSLLTREELQIAENAIELAKDSGHRALILEEAVKMYLELNKGALDTKTLSEHATDWLKMKAKTVSEETLRGYRPRVRRCIKEASWGNKTCIHFQPGPIFDFVNNEDSSQRTKINDRQAMLNFWRYLKLNKLVNWDFEEHIPKPKSQDAIPEILTPGELKDIIKVFRKHEPRLLPWLVICAFSGVRPQGEYSRLSEGDINTEESYILVRSPKANPARYIPMEPNLKEWIIYLRGENLPMVWHQKKVFFTLRKETKFKWQQDILRHSYASYMAPRITLHELQDKMGSTERTIKRFYKKLVRNPGPWWDIKPSD